MSLWPSFVAPFSVFFLLFPNLFFSKLITVVSFTTVALVAKIHSDNSTKVKHADVHFADQYEAEHVVPMHYYEDRNLDFEANEIYFIHGYVIFKNPEEI